MAAKYYTILTHTGAALHANAQITQTTVPWTHMALGDGGGNPVTPKQEQKGLVREVHRLPITAIEAHQDNPNWIVVEAVVPNSVGGFTVREASIIGGTGGSTIAVGNYPDTYKPVLSEGAVREMVMRMIVEISSAATVNLVIDPAVAIASRDHVDKAIQSELGKRGKASGRVVIKQIGVTHWSVPEILRSGHKKARVRGVGGGGGPARKGGGPLGTHVTGGSGGGGFDIVLSLEGVEIIPVTVGGGGTVGVGLDSPGTPGGSTSFGTFATGKGGPGGWDNGSSPGGGEAVSSVPGAILISGQGGGISFARSDAAGVLGGPGGASMLGFGGVASVSGSGPSGYGGGAGASVVGGVFDGAQGVVIIEW